MSRFFSSSKQMAIALTLAACGLLTPAAHAGGLDYRLRGYFAGIVTYADGTTCNINLSTGGYSGLADWIAVVRDRDGKEVFGGSAHMSVDDNWVVTLTYWTASAHGWVDVLHITSIDDNGFVGRFDSGARIVVKRTDRFVPK